MDLSTAVQLVVADLRGNQPDRYRGEDLDVVMAWLDEGYGHGDIDDELAADQITDTYAAAYHLVLEAGHGPIKTVLLGTAEQAAAVDAAFADRDIDALLFITYTASHEPARVAFGSHATPSTPQHPRSRRLRSDPVTTFSERLLGAVALAIVVLPFVAILLGMPAATALTYGLSGLAFGLAAVVIGHIGGRLRGGRR